MEKPVGTVGKIFYYIWRGFDINRRVVIGLFALFFTIFFLISLLSGGDKIKVPEGSALIFAPAGVITEQPVWVDPVEKAINDSLGNGGPSEESVYDLLEVLRNAKEDDRITTLIIKPQGILSVGPAMLEMLRDGIADFKESGKPVIAMGDFYGQPQYYLAAQADEVYVHPYGGVLIEGYSRVRTYYASLIEKLKVTPNVFKVGTFKSAVEPYLRDNMSEPAKEANLAFLNDIWQSYRDDMAKARGIDAQTFHEQVNQIDEVMVSEGGDPAKVALKFNLVDGLKTRPEFRDMMIERVGENEEKNSYKAIGHRSYLKAVKPPIDFVNPRSQKVAVIVAKGVIMDGKQKEGTIGGTTLANKIYKARTDENTKAIVLRVDSPGGSAFASEIIREEIVKAKEQGLPVVVSMGTYAASGGYWISANADEIWARPTTLTGSIGIFGMIPTFEKTLAWAGVHRDGVGTTELAGAFDTGRELSQPIKDIIQANIENGYKRFINLVANGRNMTPEEVDNIAQGRIWSGLKAKELGLVDQIGTLNDAIKSAAKMAGLEDKKYDTWWVKRKLTPNEELMQQLFKSSVTAELVDSFISDDRASTSEQFISTVQKELDKLSQFNDPNHAYVLCQCEIQ